MSTPAGRWLRSIPAVAAVIAALLLGCGILVGAPARGATPPPTPVPPSGSLSPFPTALETRPPLPRHPPRIGAKALLLAEVSTGQVLLARRAQARRPVASLTKLMTAYLVLERGKLGQEVTVSAEAAPPINQLGISNLSLRPGERISVEELLYALLLQSANDSAVALAEHAAGSTANFVKQMNQGAERLGATGTRFTSPSGLDDSGYSTASDLALIMRAVLDQPKFRKIASTKFHEVPAPPGGKVRSIQNRNVLLWLYPGTVAGKTGYTRRAGYCLVAVARRDGRELVAVLLGEKGEAFSDAAELFDWGFRSFVDSTVASAGDDLGTRQVQGAGRPLALGRDIEGLVLKAERNDIRLEVRIDEAAPPDTSPGQRVGTATAVAPSGVVGTAPVVIAATGADAADAEPTGPTSAWNHAFEVVAAEYARTLEKVSG